MTGVWYILRLPHTLHYISVISFVPYVISGLKSLSRKGRGTTSLVKPRGLASVYLVHRPVNNHRRISKRTPRARPEAKHIINQVVDDIRVAVTPTKLCRSAKFSRDSINFSGDSARGFWAHCSLRHQRYDNRQVLLNIEEVRA